jgi:membrane protein implicated in regulation of membrane protease activity
MKNLSQTTTDKLNRINRRITIGCVVVCLIAGTVALPVAGVAAAAFGGGAALKFGLALAGGGLVALTTAAIGHSLMKRAERTAKQNRSAQCDCLA